ncbi:MAG: DUF72 domain-containing protein [Bacillota bacterium]
MGEILVGTCAWADHAPFYPRGTKPTDRLRYYASFFPLVEVDSTYYAMQPAARFAAWAQSTPEHFRFNVKAYRAITRHDRAPKPGEEDVGFLAERFSEALEPMRAEGKLVAVHLQFPPWFVQNAENEAYLAWIREFFPKDIVAVEFRHRSWWTDERREETLGLLRVLQAANVVVDEPQVGSGSIPMVPEVTHPKLSVFRFHGRNKDTWYIKAKDSGERFRYLYNRDELSTFVPIVRGHQAHVEQVHLLLNNNYQNYAVINGFDLMELFDQPVQRPGLLSFTDEG